MAADNLEVALRESEPVHRAVVEGRFGDTAKPMGALVAEVAGV